MYEDVFYKHDSKLTCEDITIGLTLSMDDTIIKNILCNTREDKHN